MDTEVKAYLERQSIIKNYQQIMNFTPEEIKSKLNAAEARLNQIESSEFFTEEEIKKQAEPLVAEIASLRTKLRQADELLKIPVHGVEFVIPRG